MRGILKHFIIDTVCLYLISLAVNGMVFAKGIETIVLTGLVLALTTLIIKPIINILLLPINLITFGLFKWAGYAITLYLVTLIVPGFKILEFVFKGYETYWLSIPSISFHGALAIIAFSFVITLTSSIIYWIFK